MARLFLDGSKLFHHLGPLNRYLSGEDIAPVHVEVSPTNACNMRCVFCYADHSEHAMGSIPGEAFLRLMDSMARMGVKSCLLAGDGEPLLNPATVDAIVRGREGGVDMALNTNGLAMGSRVSERVLGCLVWLRFSVMASDPETYGFLHGTDPGALDVVLENIARAVEAKRRHGHPVTIGIQQVLLPENARDVPRLARLARDIGVDYYVLKPFSLHPLNEGYRPQGVGVLHETFAEHLREAESLSGNGFTAIVRWRTFSDRGERDYDRCLGLSFLAQIAADGGVYTCCPFFGNPRFLYGRIQDDDFERIWSSDRRRAVVRNVEETVDVHRDCMSFCRHHQINRVLWDLVHPPEHVNFL